MSIKVAKGCNLNETCTSMPKIAEDLYFRQACYCDSKCSIYNDCCSSFINNQLKSKPDTEFKCILERNVCVGENNDNNYIYSIGSCPSHYNLDLDIRKKCLYSNFLEERKYTDQNEK